MTRRTSHCRSAAGAFTLIELMVVMAIIVVLIGAVLVASSSLINKARSSTTQAMLTLVRDAVEQFHREQSENPTITRDPRYRERYGLFPPDELEVFSDTPSPFVGRSRDFSLAVRKARIHPAPPYEPMKFYTKGLPPEEQAVEHRDLSAMIIAILDLGDTSRAILERIDDRYWTEGVLDSAKDPPEPLLFLDRPDGATYNGAWDAREDLNVRWIIDDWGNPIGYMAQRLTDEIDPGKTESRNLPIGPSPGWNAVSSELVRLNSGQPVIFSYGPNGEEQLTGELMGDKGAASLIGDFENVNNPGEPAGKIDDPINADNLYADPSLKEKLATGIEGHAH